MPYKFILCICFKNLKQRKYKEKFKYNDVMLSNDNLKYNPREHGTEEIPATGISNYKVLFILFSVNIDCKWPH